MRKDLKLGGLAGIYIIFKNNDSQIGEEIRRVILEELFNTMGDYENQEHIYLQCALEIIALIGPNERSYARIGTIKALMCDPNQKLL